MVNLNKDSLKLRQVIEGETGQRFSNNKISCPFQQGGDSNPSFALIPDPESGCERYKCFSCGKFGDVIQFIIDFTHINYYYNTKQF